MQVQEAIIKKSISERHARALMHLKTKEEQVGFLKEIIDKQLNVRETDELIKNHLEGSQKDKKVKRKTKFVSKDIRIVTNTIRRSVKMIESEEVKIGRAHDLTQVTWPARM